MLEPMKGKRPKHAHQQERAEETLPDRSSCVLPDNFNEIIGQMQRAPHCYTGCPLTFVWQLTFRFAGTFAITTASRRFGHFLRGDAATELDAILLVDGDHFDIHLVTDLADVGNARDILV